ncbi:glycosyltransferase family 2 protein [Bacillus cereus]
MIKENSVAIIIVNWNGYQDTYECLKSLETLDYKNHHVFLVDNGSVDGSGNKIEADYKSGKFNLGISFLYSKDNLGFAGGNNIAIKQAYEEGYEFFWMLNNDTIVEKEALKPLVEHLKENTVTGIVGSKILYYDSDKIWFAGGELNALTGKTKHIGFKEVDTGQYDMKKEVGYITGCSLCFRREVLEEVGYMFEDYFLYYEETDWNIRVKQNGFIVEYIPDSVIYHKVSISSGGENNIAPYVAYYYIRNSLVMVKRTQSRWVVPIAFIFGLYNSLKLTAKIILRKQNDFPTRVKYIVRGIIDGINNKLGKHV